MITSKSGAALHDIVSTIRRRNTGVRIALRPTQVQGENAAYDIALAIEEFNQSNLVDVLILGRGGGSIEDLWAFNEEIVARAIYNSRLPIISAVGHEIDFTIADFVSDARAATPTAAVELAVHDQRAMLSTLRNLYKLFRAHSSQNILDFKRRVNNVFKSASFHEPLHLVRRYMQTRDEFDRQIRSAMTHRVMLNRQRIENMDHILHSLHPKAPLKRGFAIVRSQRVIVMSGVSLKPGENVEIEFTDGIREGTITK